MDIACKDQVVGLILLARRDSSALFGYWRCNHAMYSDGLCMHVLVVGCIQLLSYKCLNRELETIQDGRFCNFLYVFKGKDFLKHSPLNGAFITA